VDTSNGRNNVPPPDLWLSYRDCVHIAKTVFGNEQDPLCREFLSVIESHLEGQRRSGQFGQVRNILVRT